MLCEPASERILASIRETLRERVAPSVSEHGASAALEAIDLMLASVIRRVEREAEWMRQEIDAIVDFARSCMADDADHGRALGERLNEVLRSERSGSAEDLRAQYKAAGILLNRCLDHSYLKGGGLRARADAIIAERVAHETQLLGAFHIVGKT